ncbi:chitin deacetylase [Geranomyces variabilis]|uniref:Chitin deacetylase n=1 Tax=Geranomyces variabilis TaxID=109894 RepID=A0AAD5TSH0_9FUNG|nr:chitin deacetylase [Geranomyces variabilis]
MFSSLIIRSSLLTLVASHAVVALSAVPTASAAVAASTTRAAQTAGPDPTLAAAAGAASYPYMPVNAWPDPDQTKGPINLPALLNSPLVLDGLKRVQAIVPAALLNVAVASTQAVLGDGTINYVGDATAAGMCWGEDQCYRTVAANGYEPDITACPAANTWGLTFDDGPTDAVDSTNATDLVTSDLTAALKAINTHATMFVVGSQSYYHPQDVLAMYQAGHEIAVHTWTHAALTTISNAQIIAEVLYGEAMITRIIGVRPRFFRPPYRTILWGPNYDSGDSHGATAAQVLATAQSWIKPGPGFITLDHNIEATTTAMSVSVVKMIQAMKANNTFPLSVMAVGECLGLTPYISPSGAALSTASSAAASTAKTAASTSSTGSHTSTAVVPGATTSSSPTSTSTAKTTAKTTPTNTAADVTNAASGQKGVAGIVGAVGAAALAAGLAL